MQLLFRSFILILLMACNLHVMAETPGAAIIFDASGSMWGKINGKTKIAIAKDALRNVVNNWNPDIPLGLTIYGHRRKGDCNDIETLIPAGKINKQEIASIIGNITPRGKTPITRSIQKVARELQYTRRKVTIILISDGKETCDPDPVEAARILKQQGFELIIHVIGFSVGKGISDQLQAIARTTGGIYLPAKDASTLNKAINVIASKVQKPKPIVRPKYNLQISASETERSKWVQALHKLYSSGGDASSRMLESCISYDRTRCRISVPAGSYVVRSSYNLFQKQTSIQVDEESVTTTHVTFGETGDASITARENVGGKRIALHYSIFYGDEKTLATSGETLAERAVMVKLPVGKYIIRSEYCSYRNRLPLEISAGTTISEEIITGETGTITVSASETKGGEWIDASHAFYKGQIDESGNNLKAVCDSEKQKTCRVQLPVGDYVIQTRYRGFAITTAAKVRHESNIAKNIIMKPTGRFEIVARERQNSRFIEANYTIVPADKNKTEGYPRVSSGRTRRDRWVREELFTGKYWVEAEYCTYQKRLPVEVGADSVKQVEFIMGETGNAIVSAILKKGGASVQARYTLYRDRGGKLELMDILCETGADASCSLHLPVGGYRIKALYDPFVQSKKFHIAAGKTSSVIFVMNPSGSVSIRATEGRDGKDIKALYGIYRVIDNEIDENNLVKSCRSEEKFPCQVELPIGRYVLRSSYNRFKKEMPFEVKEEEQLKLHVIMGGTGEVNISAYTKINGHPIPATFYILQRNNNTSKEIESCWSTLHCIKRLPVGRYFVRSEYNILKTETPFEIRAGESRLLPVIIGETGIVKIHAIELLGNQMVEADHMIYKVADDGKLNYVSLMCWYDKKLQGCSVTLPTGKYLLQSTYQDVRRKTPFEIKGDETNEVNVTFDTHGESKR